MNTLASNKKFRDILTELGLELNNEFLDLGEALIRECAKIAHKEQAWNDAHELQVNIDQCILCDFDLPDPSRPPVDWSQVFGRARNK